MPGVTAGAVEAEFAEVVKVLQRKLTKDYSAGARYRDAMEAAKAAAAKLIMQTDKVTVNNEWLDIRDLKKKLRDTKGYVSENVASEIPDWQSVRKEISGALSVVTTDRSALPLDSFYSDLAEEYPEYVIGKVNVDEEGELAKEFGVMSIPTLVVLKGGEVANRIVGSRNEAQILELLNV